MSDVPRQQLKNPTQRAPTAASHDSIASAVASVRRLVRVLRLHAQRTQSAAGIGAAQLFVLQQLGSGDYLSLSELATRTMTDRSSVADIVERLGAQGLVDRAVDPTDRRRAAIRITALGQRTLARAPEAPTTALIGALRAMHPRECRALARSLTALNRALGVADEPATMLFADEPPSPARGRKSRGAGHARGK
ncbi:MAG: MarR family winged helix-turn-helix transcriptional regulator [bacterium]